MLLSFPSGLVPDGDVPGGSGRRRSGEKGVHGFGRMWKWKPGERSAEQHQNDVALAIAAVANAAAIFITDTFTSIESAVAIFYVIVMLLAADFLSKEGVIVGGVLCGLLSMTSFAVLQGAHADLGAVVRLGGSLSAVGVTTALLFRRETNRLALLASHGTTRVSEDRYRSIFQRSPLALWEQDVTGLKPILEGLKAAGVTDMGEYMQAHPEFLVTCTLAIRSVAINDAMFDMLGHSHDVDVTGPIAKLIPHDCPALAGFVKAAFEGQRRSESKGRVKDANGGEKIVLMTAELPENESDMDRVVVGLIDISRQEAAQVTMMAAQSELARASRASAVGALSASVAHELSQPLGALLANAQACLRWLRRDPPDIDAANKAAERMLRDGVRVSVSATVPPADFVAITNTVEIESAAEVTWQRIGSFADAGKYLGVVSELVSGDGDIGSVRKIGDGILEVKVGSGIFSYAYMQSVGPMAAVAYHGNVSLEPTGQTSCRLVYTISYDQALMSGEARRKTSERIAPRFKGMAEAMKAEAEKG